MHQIDNEQFSIVSAQVRVLSPVRALNPFQDSSMGPFNTFGLSVLTLEDEDGNVGEAPVFSSYINILEKCFLPILLHNHHIFYRDLYPMLYWSIRNEGFRGQASALLGQLDMALYDLAARRKQLPLYKYLNADRNYVKMYGSGGGTNYTYKELETEIACFLDKGVDTIKMKVGKDFGTKMAEDVERVKFVRRFLGKDIKLALDANQVWSYEEALKFVHLVEGENIAWLEEPIHSAAYVEIEQLCKRSAIEIAYGESERSAKMFPALVNAGVSHLQPVPTLLGSMKEWMAVRDLALHAGSGFSSGGYTLYTASLMASAPEHWQVEYLYTIMQGLNDYFEVYPSWTDGRFVFPETHGLPLRIDWDYWTAKHKIIMSWDWTQKKIAAYTPTVTM